MSESVLSTTATNWISSGNLNQKLPVEDIPLETSGYTMNMFYRNEPYSCSRTVGSIAPKWIGAKKGCEINGEYWSSQEAHDIL